ncbi:39S ribosomal protein L30 mitochondrial [Fasciola gigantica]|uniref:39S ribosomal protein L30 mitochondrial n=1 Tax=Fasciola gigantica TaxID=46835 RepID=A0A504YCP0_FASGI|nr:39S ribosomal protein L30 mitochondrial [Fasciola gigantica]
MKQSALVFLKKFAHRSLHTSTAFFVKGKTLEPNPVPGSKEHLDPNAWAKRLFKLHEKRKVNSISTAVASPLHMVCRLKPLKGVPYYERAVLEKYGLGGGVKNFHWIVVENTPSVNSELNTVKHLLRIQPVTFPQGLPTDTDDLTKCRLMPDGRFLRTRGQTVRGEVVSDSHGITINSHRESNEFENNDPEKLFAHAETGESGYLTRSYLRQFHNRRWSKQELFNEHFASHYRYRLNQDGLEYRYSRLWRLDDAMFQSAQNQFNSYGTRKTSNQNRFQANWMTYPWSKF